MVLCILTVIISFHLNDSAFSFLCAQVKFNRALADHSMSDKPRLIDGIVLTKFDTIDDKVSFYIYIYIYTFDLLNRQKYCR